MIIYLAGGSPNYSLAVIRHRLLSYHYHAAFIRKRDQLKIYLAGGERQAWADILKKAGAENSLYSYHYLSEKRRKEFKVTTRRVFLDSGGFSAATQNVSIDITEYCDFIHKHADLLTCYANLDIIGNAKKTKENQDRMEKDGLAPVPVFHYAEDFAVLKEMAQKYSYIAIGGLVPLSREEGKIIPFLDRCFSVCGGSIRLHGFGMTNYKLLQRYPFYSVDSTSWLSGVIRADIYSFNAGILRSRSTSVRSETTTSSFRFTDQKDPRYLARISHNAIVWQQVEEYLTELWKKRGVVWND